MGLDSFKRTNKAFKPRKKVFTGVRRQELSKSLPVNHHHFDQSVASSSLANDPPGAATFHDFDDSIDHLPDTDARGQLLFNSTLQPGGRMVGCAPSVFGQPTQHAVQILQFEETDPDDTECSSCGESEDSSSQLHSHSSFTDSEATESGASEDDVRFPSVDKKQIDERFTKLEDGNMLFNLVLLLDSLKGRSFLQ